jgi:hypothetical protein
MKMDRKRAFWIGGTATAFAGVGLVRLLAPELTGSAEMIALASGYVLAVLGITLISFATRRKPDEAFVMVDRPAKRRARS